jgi:ribulose-5-phosphate 4-epimerase/fuculose-1-phosphate aldolase
MITQDACAFFDDQSLLKGFTGVVVDVEEGRRIARTLDQHKAIILQNHGLLTVGRTVDEAAWWFITMERSCQAQLAAEAVGKPVIIDEDSAQSTYNVVGSHLAGWFSFQPLFERVARDQPDLLE